MDVKKTKLLAAQIRLETLKVIRSRGFGHVGGSMDLADLMAVLYGEVMRYDPQNPRWEDRDWLVMSKGHAGPVVTAENHNVTCGLGSAVAGCLARRCPTVQEFVGVNDQFGQVGPQAWLMDTYGLRAQNIVQAVKRALERK